SMASSRTPSGPAMRESPSNSPTCSQPSAARRPGKNDRGIASPKYPRQSSGSDSHLDYAFPPFTKQLVGSHDMIECETVCQKRPQIEAAVAHQLHQPTHPLLAARAKRGDDLVIAKARGKRFERDGQFSRIHAEARQRATGT